MDFDHCGPNNNYNTNIKILVGACAATGSTTYYNDQDEYIEDYGREIFIPFWYDKLAANNK